jgi:hypothetical protein
MTAIAAIALFLLLAALPTVENQLCDDNPHANNGVKIAFQASSSCLKGRTHDLTKIGTCADNTAFDIRLPFAFNFLGRNYNGSVFVGANSYVTFGGGSTAWSGFGSRNPPFPTIFIGARDNAMSSLFVGPDALGWRVRYEGWSLPSLVSTHKCMPDFPPTIVWELTILRDHTLQLCTGFLMQNITGVSAVSDGVSDAYVQKFILTPSTSYNIYTALQPCQRENDPMVRKGVKIMSQPSNSCMKGRTPDMIDIRSCQRAGSTNILLPFPFNFLGRTYGGQSNNVYVGDSSFVTFGGPDNTYYSSFGPDFSSMPALLIGARQNVLKTLSVAPDPLGWRVRYEGWSDHGASLDNYPPMSQAFVCAQNQISAENRLSNFAPNITWELIFMHDGTLQLCTSSLMANLDPIFDSVAIQGNVCNEFCSNFFQNLSAVSAVSEGSSNSFLQTFALTPSTLFTISTGIPQHLCDDNPEINNGVKVESHGTSTCLKGPALDMKDVGSCQDFAAYSVELPFPIHFLGRSYSGGDVFVGSKSYVTFGSASTTSGLPSVPSLLIGGRNNAMRRLSVGRDPHGWRVRFEGWDMFLTQLETFDCKRPANIIWELLFLQNNTLQLCTGSLLANIDLAQEQPATSALWDGRSFVANFSLDPLSLYSFSFRVPPCSLHISLSCPVASVNGTSMTASFPQFGKLRFDSVTLLITLQGAGFSSASNTSISLVVSPASIRATGTASISKSGSATPLLLVSLSGVENCTLESFTLPLVTTPLLPQSSRKSVRFSVLGPSQSNIFSSESGSLVEILPLLSMDVGQPTLHLISNAIRATTTMNITLIPDLMNIPATFLPSVLVITLSGAGWSLPNTIRGQFIRPQAAKIVSAAITTDTFDSPVLRVVFSGVEAINRSSSLMMLLFDVVSVNSVQPDSSNIRSAILNNFGSVVALGAFGRLEGAVASSMGIRSPTVTVSPSVVSAPAVDIEVSFTPSPLFQFEILLPARIIVTLSGSFSCGTNTTVNFMSPLNAENGIANMLSFTNNSILTINVQKGTFLSGYPVLFHFGPCLAPNRPQPQMTDVSAAMIDRAGNMVAASTSGTLSAIVEDIGQLKLVLVENALRLTLTPRVLVPANSFLVVSLTGLGLIFRETTALQFLQPASGASGTATVEGRPLESIISVSFLTRHLAGASVVFIISPVYGGCSAEASNFTAALYDSSENILAATKSSFFSATAMLPTITVQQLIVGALNGVIVVPEGTFAGKCNCNNVINTSIPVRPTGSVVEMRGSAGQSIIDCSGTGMRCLIVEGSSINVVNIIFRGGSSPVFLTAGSFKVIQAFFDAENPNYPKQEYRTRETASSGTKRSLLENFFRRPFRDARVGRHQHRSLEEVDMNAEILNKRMLQYPHTVSNSRVPISAHKLRRTSNRRLFQSNPGGSTAFSMFSVDAIGAGGCLMVLAPKHSVSLSGVSMVNCSAVRGGGGFFNVSIFTAIRGNIQRNIARQGGGWFVAASQKADIEHVNFMNNTVFTTAVSLLSTWKLKSYTRLCSLIPDPAAATGGGVWVQLLSVMKNCTFEHNLALGSGGNSPTNAIGSSLYILQTSDGSELSRLQFSKSIARCSGHGCIAAGTVFVGFAGFNTFLHRMAFVECHVAAIGTLATTFHWPLATALANAWGSGIVVHDASAGSLKINDVQSFRCSAKSSGHLTGGFMYFAQRVVNAVISNISIFNFNIDSDLLTIHTGCLLTFLSVENTIISDVTVISPEIVYRITKNRLYGVILWVGGLQNSSITSLNVTSLMFRVEGCSSSKTLVYGGLAQIGSMDALSILTNISMQHSSFYITCTMTNPGFMGWVFYINSNFGLNLNVATATLRGISVRNCSASSTGDVAFMQCLGLFQAGQPVHLPSTLKDIYFQNVFQSCNGSKCRITALVNIDMASKVQTPVTRAQKYNTMLQLSDFYFANVSSQCVGDQCALRGGCFQFLSVYSGVIRNVRMNNVSLQTYGSASFAGGTFMYHLFNDPLGSFLIRNITSENAAVRTSGVASYAIGGVVVALYALFSIVDIVSLKSLVVCSGTNCKAAGGAFALARSYGPSPLRSSAYSVYVSNAEVSDAVVHCQGVMCSAEGGAAFVVVANRGPLFEGTNAVTTIAPKGFILTGLNVVFTDSIIQRCTIKSQSKGSILTGAGVSVILAVVEFVNSSILFNSIQPDQQTGFAAGAGIYVAGPKSRASLATTALMHNSAGTFGMGGAMFAGPDSVLKCDIVIVESNYASRGGGLLADLASVSFSSSIFRNNSATDKGGGLFYVSSSSIQSSSVLVLNNVTVVGNFLQTNESSAVGAAVYIFGDVLVGLHNNTRIVMTGDSKFTTSESILSLIRPVNMSNDTVFSCMGGTVLGVTPTEVSNQIITLTAPDVVEELETQCSPACLYSPVTTPYMASGGLLASCIPCPRGTYSIAASSIFNDTVASRCLPCPFGALCHGGSNFSAAKSHWGWKTSESQLAPYFVRLPSGFGCEENCTSVAPCGGKRAGVLCGACATNYSVAFFQSQCVPSLQCASWKWAPLIFLCFLYQFLFSVWLYWSSEAELFEKQENHCRSAKQALNSISLFQSLSSEKIDALVSKMELVYFPKKSMILIQGRPGLFMYIIETGVLNVSVLDGAGNENVVASLGAPNAVGELSLINGTNCNASIRAEVDSQLWRLDRSCLDQISEEEKSLFVKAKLAQYAKPAVKFDSQNAAGSDAEEELSSAFGVLMWFYQLAGIMLSVASPLDYLDGSAIAFSFVSFFVNSKPSSEAASDVSKGVVDEERDEYSAFKFCISSSFTMSQLYITTFMYYVVWLLLMVVLSRKLVWRILRNTIIRLSFGVAQFLDIISGYVKRWYTKNSNAPVMMTLQEQFTLRQNIDIDIRGPAFLKWFITCFSAAVALMMQGTACVRLNGFLDADDDLRWIYDGRVACFSDSGDFPGQWQIAPAWGVALFFLLPAALWKVTSRIQKMEKRLRTPFQETLWEAYSGPHSSNACHWMVVM